MTTETQSVRIGSSNHKLLTNCIKLLPPHTTWWSAGTTARLNISFELGKGRMPSYRKVRCRRATEILKYHPRMNKILATFGIGTTFPAYTLALGIGIIIQPIFAILFHPPSDYLNVRVGSITNLGWNFVIAVKLWYPELVSKLNEADSRRNTIRRITVQSIAERMHALRLLKA